MITNPLTGVVVAAILVLCAWRLSRHVVTVVHESGHALLALFLGGSGVRVKVLASSAGSTDWNYDPEGDREVGVLPLLAGYPAPLLVGLGGALALQHGMAETALLVMTGMLVLVLLMVRNAFGVLVVLATGGAALVVARYAPTSWQVLFVGVMTWLLLIGGARDAIGLFLRTDGDQMTDDDFLAEATWVPAFVWRFVFVAAALGALYYAARVVVGW